MKTCISVIVNDIYQKYIPIFSYFISKSYPDYGIKIFLTNRLNKDYKGIINKIQSNSNLLINENVFNGKYNNTGQCLKSLRWFLTDGCFDGFDNIYIGDVDLLICREQFSLESQHLKHCIDNNLPYSNCLRPGQKRFSGLHFIKKKEYFNIMNSIILKYAKSLKLGKIKFSKDFRNEHLLYNMIYESGFGLPEEKNRIDPDGSGPHHGLHIGIWRAGNNLSKGVVNHLRIDNYLNHYIFFKKEEFDPLFKEIMDLIPIKEIIVMKKYLENIFGE